MDRLSRSAMQSTRQPWREVLGIHRFVSVIMSAVLFAAVSACGGGDEDASGDSAAMTAAVLSAEAERGRQIFVDRGGPECRECHSLDGSEEDGPTFLGISEVAAERVPGLSAEEYVYQAIVDPTAHFVPGWEGAFMNKTYGILMTEADINSLVAFILSQ